MTDQNISAPTDPATNERIGDVVFSPGDACLLSSERVSTEDYSDRNLLVGDDRIVVVTNVGSNYVEVSWPTLYVDQRHRPEVNHAAIRLHVDELRFLTPLEPERIAALLGNMTAAAKAEITSLTSKADKLVEQQMPTPDAQDKMNAGALIALNQCQSPEVVKQGLIDVRDTALPEVYRHIGIATGRIRMGMEFQMMMLTANVRPLQDMISIVQEKLFTIELYAGIHETVRQFRSGAPAGVDDKLTIFQRMVYMDEESLLDYQAGGMDYQSVDEWDEWLARPENLARVMPFSKTMMIARIRRFNKDRETHTISDMFVNINAEKADKKTFIYIRNGENLFRIDTAIDFGSKAFPDSKNIDLTEEMVFEVFCSEVRRIIPAREAEAEGNKSRLGYKWHKLNPTSVFYDDATAKMKSELDAFRRFGLILQGLFDRSDLLKPSHAVKLWDNESFTQNVRLILDSDRTLYSGETPDFESYRENLNAQATADSVFIGQKDYWMRREAEKENERQRKDYRIKNPTFYKRFRPEGDPGPALMGVGVSMRGGKVSFHWEKWSETRGGDRLVQKSISVPLSEMLNISAYRKGDFKRFFADPRTRERYIQWAPLLLGAEEYLAEMEENGEIPDAMGLTSKARRRRVD